MQIFNLMALEQIEIAMTETETKLIIGIRGKAAKPTVCFFFSLLVTEYQLLVY